MSDYNRCDVCKIENDNVKAGRWIFYCPLHKETDIRKTIENERPFDGDMNDVEGIYNSRNLIDVLDSSDALFKPKICK